MKTCKKCGSEIGDDMKFCPCCGAAQEDESAGASGTSSSDNAGSKDNAAGTGYYQQQKPYQEFEAKEPNGAGDDKTNPNYIWGIVTYITIIGFIIAICSGNLNDDYLRYHLNLSVVLNIFALLSCIPVIGCFWGIFVLVCWIIALIGACNGEKREVPLFSGIHIIN